MRYTPTTIASAKAETATMKAARSVSRPLTMAWLARGLAIVSMPLRTS